jgi:hypothetical protein
MAETSPQKDKQLLSIHQRNQSLALDKTQELNACHDAILILNLILTAFGIDCP